MARCKAKTRTGKRCRNTAKEGGDRCGAHGGKAGRRLSLDSKIREGIVLAISGGAYNAVAARAVGISETTFYRWMEQGELDAELEEETEFRELWEQVKKAEAEAEVYAVAKVIEAAQGGDWRAAMTYLERKYPKRWARREVREVGGIGGGPVTLLDLERAVDGGEPLPIAPMEQ